MSINKVKGAVWDNEDNNAAFFPENTYSLSSTDLDPNNGTIQYTALSGATTFTESFVEGESMTFMVNPNSINPTWPSGMKWIGGSAPTLEDGDYNVIVFWKANGQFYGNYIGLVG